MYYIYSRMIAYKLTSEPPSGILGQSQLPLYIQAYSQVMGMRPALGGARTSNAPGDMSRSYSPAQPAHLSVIAACTVFPWSRLSRVMLESGKTNANH